MNKHIPFVVAALAIGSAPATASGQSLGPFQWQLEPYCNVLTLAVTGTTGAYRVEGIDDQCGTRAASVVGVASLNADGSAALGMSIVTTPGGLPVHLRATLDTATLIGTWRDSLGNSGALVPPPAGGATGNPRGRPGADLVRAADIDPTQVQRRVSESCAAGRFVRGIEETGAVSCTAAASEPITAVRAGPGLLSLRFGAEVDLRLPVDRLDNAAGFVSNVPLGNSGSNPISGPGRIFAWYPGKAAFRVGEVYEPQSHDSSIGAHSVGMGLSTNASGSHSVVLGFLSVAHRQGGIALGQSSFAAGATSVAMGQAGGGSNGALGASSFAAGRGTQAGGTTSVAMGTNVAVPFDVPGSFVFGDNHTAPEHRMVGGANQFNVRADSLVSICSNPAATTCVVTGLLNPGWHSASDARLKEHFRDLSGEQVLAALALLPIREWNYKTQHASISHVGPTAQDFHAAFGLGETPRQISTVDADGIALAALKAIEARTRALAKAHRRRQREEHTLGSRLERLECLTQRNLMTQATFDKTWKAGEKLDGLCQGVQTPGR